MNYKVTDKIREPYKSFIKIDADQLQWAQKLSDEYGLGDYFNLVQIINIWSEFSKDCYNTRWMIPNRLSVETAFGVILEEFND